MKKEKLDRLYGDNCRECGKKLGEYRLDGPVNGEKMSFCCFDCCDNYRDKHEQVSK